MSKKRVLVGPGDFAYVSPERSKQFKEKFDVTVVDNLDNIKEIIKDYEGVLSRYHVKFSQEVLENAVNLKVLARQGAGYDEIDSKFAAKKGIWVTNTPNVIAKATADVALAHLLNVSRRFSESERFLREGKTAEGGWAKFLARDPEGKTLGIIGMGNIGKELAKRAAALEMNIIYYNRNRLPVIEEVKYGNAKYVTKDELLAQSDFISVNVFASPETKHILNSKDFSKMKKGVYIINTSRGVTINEQALVDALKSGIVAGAGLDVFEFEPKVHPDLYTFPNVSLTPHIGTATSDTRMQMEELAIKNIESVLEGKPPLTPVPECNILKNPSKL
jgi:lactate dehydrogenase-like 2-hydroxyacid dehydrogenase